ncbi:MAG TPA: anthranilate synthase component I [Chthoniobacterales bacterium]|jgi:anthranilate synthase component 1|nr:anthranilate synthase component I [Chthoniobacterales bacterium]
MTSLPLNPSRLEFRNLAGKGNLIPIFTEFVADYETPIAVFEKIDSGVRSFLLESAEGNDRVGRYSFLGSDPRIYFEARGRHILIEEGGQAREFETQLHPLAELQRVMKMFRAVTLPGLPPFSGGAVGYIGYDAVRFFEPSVGAAPPDQLGLPEMVFMVIDTFLVFDHRFRSLKIFANAFIDEGKIEEAYETAAEKIRRIVEKLETPTKPRLMNAAPVALSLSPRSNTTREEFHEMVRKAKQHIEAGDIFQMVPSQRFEARFDGDPLALYRALRFINPSPYMFCLRLGEKFALVGSSPEVHVRLRDRTVEIRPIAGTRKRGATGAEDERLSEELLADPKERAEHLMLVDLARNDVGRISKYGTVKVTEFMAVERYSHVMHIVSNVVGELRSEYTAYDVMPATFPAGTVSGAPKVRAMQLIYEFEKSKRGVYAGAVGYFGFDGQLDSCIALRTVVLKDGTAYVQAGGGVVADSEPELEYQESVNKAMASFCAIERAENIV